MADEIHRVELKKQDAMRFRRIATLMTNLLNDVREYIPEANLYLEDSGNWHILSGESHDYEGWMTKARQDRSLAREDVPHSSGGAW